MLSVSVTLGKRFARFVFNFVRTYPRIAPGTFSLVSVLIGFFVYQHHLVSVAPRTEPWLQLFAINHHNFSITNLMLATITHNSTHHLLGNIGGLLIIGWIVEHYLRPVAYLLAFFCGSAIGIFGFLLTNPPSRYGLGASAGIYFLAGFFLLYLGFPRTVREVRTYSIPIPSFYTILTLGLGFIVLLQTFILPGKDVSYTAHLVGWGGGFLFGWITASNSEMEPFEIEYTTYSTLIEKYI
jgi:membrane associated rhomboid family serine protease